MSHPNVPDSAQHAYEQMSDRDDEAALIESAGMSYCDDCDEYKSSTRTVRENGRDVERCRDCRPLDRPCEACGKAEAVDGVCCLDCCVEGDLEAIGRGEM